VREVGFRPDDMSSPVADSQTMLLQIPTGLISWVGSIVLSYIAFKAKRRNLVAFFGAIVPLVGTIILKTVPRSNQAGSMIGL